MILNFRLAAPRNEGPPLLGTFHRGRYIPDVAAHERWDAERLLAAHPKGGHVWRACLGTVSCTFCGVAQSDLAERGRRPA